MTNGILTCTCVTVLCPMLSLHAMRTSHLRVEYPVFLCPFKKCIRCQVSWPVRHQKEGHGPQLSVDEPLLTSCLRCSTKKRANQYTEGDTIIPEVHVCFPLSSLLTVSLLITEDFWSIIDFPSNRSTFSTCLRVYKNNAIAIAGKREENPEMLTD